MDKLLTDGIYELWSHYDAVLSYVKDLEEVIVVKNQKLHAKYDTIKLVAETINSFANEFSNATPFNDDELVQIYDRIIEELKKKGLNINRENFLVEKYSNDDVISREKIDINKMIEEIRKSDMHKMFLYNNAVVNFITEYENFMGTIYKSILLRDPSIIKDKTFSLEELTNCKTIDEAKDYLIFKKIVELFYCSIEKWHEIIYKDGNIKCNYFKQNLPLIVEIFQRRHVIVHNNAKVNSLYIEKTNSTKQCGDIIESDNEYIVDSTNVLICDALLTVLDYSKCLDEETNRAIIDIVFNIGFEILKRQNWKTAKVLFDYLQKNKKIHAELRTMSELNYWQCEARISNSNNYISELEKLDYSDKSSKLQIGYYALLNDKEKVYSIVENDREAINDEALKEWPIFYKLREDNNYFKKLLKLFEK